jgi:polar amino acid transport system permease protein
MLAGARLRAISLLSSLMSVNEYAWDWSVVGRYWPAFASGALVTVLLTIIVIAAGTVLGTGLGVIYATTIRELRPVRWIIRAYVELLRALPVLVLLIWLHYVVPQSSAWLYHSTTGVLDILRSEVGAMDGPTGRAIGTRAFASAAVALSLNLAAFVADVVRAGIAGVPRPLIDAAKALGMGKWLRLRRVLLPEAFRASLPALVALYITMFKFTTLAAFIGCSELLNTVFTAGNNSYRYLELYTMLAAVYLAILLPATWFARRLEQSRWFRRAL